MTSISTLTFLPSLDLAVADPDAAAVAPRTEGVLVGLVTVCPTDPVPTTVFAAVGTVSPLRVGSLPLHWSIAACKTCPIWGSAAVKQVKHYKSESDLRKGDSAGKVLLDRVAEAQGIATGTFRGGELDGAAFGFAGVGVDGDALSGADSGDSKGEGY